LRVAGSHDITKSAVRADTVSAALRRVKAIAVEVRVKARYYCGNCSREVSSNATACPYCGSGFTAVRCPKCDFEGRAPEFVDGCPSCGYMMTGHEVRVPAMPGPKKTQSTMSRRFYRIAGLVLLALFAILIVLLLLRP